VLRFAAQTDEECSVFLAEVCGATEPFNGRAARHTHAQPNIAKSAKISATKSTKTNRRQHGERFHLKTLQVKLQVNFLENGECGVQKTTSTLEKKQKSIMCNIINCVARAVPWPCGKSDSAFERSQYGEESALCWFEAASQQRRVSCGAPHVQQSISEHIEAAKERDECACTDGIQETASHS
jgi:hypothetical protein